MLTTKSWLIGSSGLLWLLLYGWGLWSSPIGLLAGSLLLLLLALFFHQLAIVGRSETWTLGRRQVVTSLSYLAIALLLGSLTWQIRQLSLNPDFPLQLTDFYRLRPAALIGLCSITLLLLTLYFVSHRLMIIIATIGLNKYQRLAALALALAVVAPILLLLDLQFRIIILLPAVFIYIALFDLFIDNQIPGITWFILWILLFALYVALLLHYYQEPVTGATANQIASLFACTLLMLSLVVLLLYSLGNALLPPYFPAIGKPSLRNRIQILAVLLTLLSFAVAGAITIDFFRRNVPDWEIRVDDFAGTLINSYAFLLLMTGAVSILIANSITRPIAEVGDKLKVLQLGKNMPIDWKSHDEIGELVSEYNRMIEKLAQSTEQLRQSEREGAWREMAKQVAHEIKNPLTPMKLSIQHLLRAAQANPQETPALLQRVSATLIEQIDGLARIATEFSGFAAMPAPHNDTFSINDTVQSVFNLFADGIEKGASLHLELPQQTLLVCADRDHMVRVLNNLLKNALQAIPDGRHGNIQVMLQRKDNYAIIQVRDNGTGIPEAMRERVFQPNFTTRSSGTGLGLAMCKNIVEAAGGRIYFQSTTQVGTDFFVEIPIATYNAEEA
jgi:signal transduction histidine kinase